MPGLDEDWIKRVRWDLPTNLSDLRAEIGTLPSDLATFLKTDAAQRMPEDMLRQSVAWLDWSGFGTAVPLWARRRVASSKRRS